MLAWKPVEFWLIGIGAVANAAVGWWLNFPMATYVVWGVHLVLLVGWLAFVNREWVRDQAEAYADQFFTELSAASPTKSKL